MRGSSLAASVLPGTPISSTRQDNSSGPGIAADVRPRVLERFTSARGAEQSGNRRHYGIGLALVADVAAAHGGTVAAGNRADGVSGAELTLTLPLRGR